VPLSTVAQRALTTGGNSRFDLDKRARFVPNFMPMKTIIQLFLAFLCLSAIGFKAKAVSPPPDGGYPGGNTAEGQAALLSLTTGGFNTAVGFLSLRSDTFGGFNTAIGAGALLANIADENTATGAGALLSTTTGSQNTANGALALLHNTTGFANTAIGVRALLNNTEGDSNTAVGTDALESNTTGEGNTAVGSVALLFNTGSHNTAVGNFALNSNTTAGANTAIGFDALSDNTTGTGNTAVGFGALASDTTGSNNTVIGNNAGTGIMQAVGTICIGANFSGEDANNSCYIDNIFNSTTFNGIGVLVNSNGRLGTTTSSARYKDEIRPMGKASDTLFSLKPVTFRYKREIDPAGTTQLGLVAEDVEKVNPDLVVRDKEGKPYSVRYDQVNAMLLNEFLKEHRKVEELRATVAQQRKDSEATAAQQQKDIQALTATVKEQASQIQKVSAQLEVSGPAPRTVLNNQ
jgi:hypothetical protein